jgi:hypothetical protein
MEGADCPHLSFGSRRFAEIRDLLPRVTEKV